MKIGIIIFLILIFSNCERFKIIDPLFYEDTIYSGKEIIFDREKLPKIGKTTELELLDSFDYNFASKWTFKRKYLKTVFAKDINVFKIYFFNQYKHSEIKGSGVTGFVGVDYLSMIVFLDQFGIVQKYLINHRVRNANPDAAWKAGPFDRMDPRTKSNESWVDDKVDRICYWGQRYDRSWNASILKYDNTQCPFWAPVFEW